MPSPITHPLLSQHLYSLAVFLNMSFVSGPRISHPLAAVLVQLLGLHLLPSLDDSGLLDTSHHGFSLWVVQPSKYYKADPEGLGEGLCNLMA